jgi:GTPase SAR1 family protein
MIWILAALALGILGYGLKHFFSHLNKENLTRAKSATLTKRRVNSEHFPNLQGQLIELASVLSSRKELSQVVAEIEELIVDLAKPLLVVVMGQFNTGKSTFINCLLKERRLVSDVRPATAAVTALSYGATPMLTVHDLDGTETAFPIEALAEVSAEGSDWGKKLRERLSYLEVQLPVALLKKATLIDTPGLNSTHESHTSATTEFSRRADMVIWLLAAGQAGTASEDQDLRRLARDLNPIVVVNQIDQLDEEEEPISVALSRIGNRLSLSKPPFGISASLALSAMERGISSEIEESGWKAFESALLDLLASQATEIRSSRVKTRLEDTFLLAQLEIEELLRERATALTDAQGGETMLDAYKLGIKTLKRLETNWRDFLKQLAAEMKAMNNGDITLYIRGRIAEKSMHSKISPDCDPSGKWSKQWSVLMSHLESLQPELSSALHEYHTFKSKETEHKKNQASHDAHVREFAKKGMIEQTFSVTERERMRATERRLEGKAKKIATEAQTVDLAVNAIASRLTRLAGEFEQLAEGILQATTQVLADKTRALENHEQTALNAKRRLDELSWLDDIELMLGQVRDMCEKAIVTDLEQSSAQRPVGA